MASGTGELGEPQALAWGNAPEIYILRLARLTGTLDEGPLPMNPIWRSDWPRPAMLALAMLLGMAGAGSDGTVRSLHFQQPVRLDPTPCSLIGPTARCWPNSSESKPTWPTANGTRPSIPCKRWRKHSEGKLLARDGASLHRAGRLLPVATGQRCRRRP